MPRYKLLGVINLNLSLRIISDLYREYFIVGLRRVSRLKYIYHKYNNTENAHQFY